MEQTDNSNHKSIRVEVEVRTETTIKEIIRIDTDQIKDQIAENRGQYRQDRSRSRYEQNFRRGNFRGNIKITVKENIEVGIEMTVMIEAETGLERGCFPEIMAIIELEVQAKVDPGQGPEVAQIGIEFIVISVGDVIISQGTVQLLGKKRKLKSSNKC